jgi:hypothetical protein
MNVKITKENHNSLCNMSYKEYLFGSQLHGISNNESDKDYIRVISDDFYNNLPKIATYLPNIHSWQYDDVTNNTQYVWMTERQFYNNLFSGDGNMIADVVILSGEFDNVLYLTRTYKIIKGYLGVAKRDLKLHGNQEKKRFHAYRSIMMAEILIDGKLPTVNDIVNLKSKELPTKDFLMNKEKEVRKILNNMLDNQEIDLYPSFKSNNELAQTMLNSNNIKEFKY